MNTDFICQYLSIYLKYEYKLYVSKYKPQMQSCDTGSLKLCHKTHSYSDGVEFVVETEPPDDKCE